MIPIYDDSLLFSPERKQEFKYAKTGKTIYSIVILLWKGNPILFFNILYLGSFKEITQNGESFDQIFKRIDFDIKKTKKAVKNLRKGAEKIKENG